MIFCPQQRGHQLMVPKLEQLSAPMNKKRVSSTPRKSSLPPPGSPISILEFSELSQSEQKQWLEGKTIDFTRECNTNLDDKLGCATTKSRCCIDMLQVPDMPHKSAGFCAGSVERAIADSHIQCPFEDTPKSSSSCGSTVETESSSLASSQDSADDDCNSTIDGAERVAQRSIFGTYWARTGQQPLHLEVHRRISYHHSEEERGAIHQDDARTTTGIATQGYSQQNHIAGTTTDQVVTQPSVPASPPCSPGSSERRSILPSSYCASSTNTSAPPLEELSFLYIPEPPNRLFLARKFRSASDLAAPSSSILKRGDERRQRSRSASVRFDAKVDVVLFQDLPPYQAPWWQRIVAAASGGFEGESR